MMKCNYPVGATPLDLSELADLLPRHIVTQEELNAWEEKNILAAQQWAFKQTDILTITFIKSLHQRMFNKTWKWAGRFRTSEKNIGIPWQLISVKTKDLCDNVQYQIEHNTFSSDEIAVRFHHGLVLIHPFPNGNGRHARLIADLLIMHLGGQRFSWGMHQDLYAATPVRQHYIAALQKADRGEFADLLHFARS